MTTSEVETLDEMFKSFYNHEYEERLHNTGRGLSAEDRLWMQKVDDAVK